MTYSAPLDDVRFAMKEVIGLDAIAHLPGYEEATPDVINAILEQAGKFASDVLAPLNAPGDREGCRLENGLVRVPSGVLEAYREFTSGGWNAVPFDPQYGGQGLPWLIQVALIEMWNAANLSFGLIPILNQAAIELLQAQGTETQKAVFLPKMIEGRWSGTMNLTEPQAGSDLGLLTTLAVRDGEDAFGKRYRLKGQKIFITYGDHALAENIIHLVIARTPNAPPGVKGLSLFVVPKYEVTTHGHVLGQNDVRCVSLEHKLGIHASPTCVMAYGDGDGAKAWLIGEENRGLEYMFIMMNNARLAVGVQGIAIAERAYQHARQYAHDRLQGRGADGKGPVPIIRHADVRRMLLSMRASIEAMRLLALHTAAQLDRAKHETDPSAQSLAQRQVDLLTPIVKAWSTDQGCQVASTGLQIHGGMGFIEETGAAQYYRDARITPIYEGTNGIQALDLATRKITRDDGLAMDELLTSMRATCDALDGLPGDDAAVIKSRLEESIAALDRATKRMIAAKGSDSAFAQAVAVPYLELAGLTAGGWMLARAAGAALERLAQGGENLGFLEAKLMTARFYAEHYLIKASGLCATIMTGGNVVLSFPEDRF